MVKIGEYRVRQQGEAGGSATIPAYILREMGLKAKDVIEWFVDERIEDGIILKAKVKEEGI